MLKELHLISYPVSLSRFNLNEVEKNGKQKIIACPQPPPEAVKVGKAIPVPKGEFNIDIILKRLPSGFSPDLVQMSARNMSFIPRGLERLSCPKAIKLGDTYQWGNGSLSEMIEYCQTLACDYHWIYQGVQHLHFFKEAGLKNVFWLPGSIAIDYFVPEKNGSTIYDVCFRGSLSGVHIYRRRLLNFLQDSGVNLDLAQKPYIASLEDYAKSKIVLNCSGGGDTNRRIFEVLMAGGFLLTDRLSSQTGLQRLFQEGVHLECYGSPEELLEKINYYLAHPEEAEKIALAGHQKLVNEYHPDLVRKELLNFIFQGQIKSPFLLQHDKRAMFAPKPVDTKRLRKRLKIYELIQCIHHLNLKIKLLYWKCRDKYLLSDLADLPRLEITCTASQENFEEISSWCSQVEIVQKVQLYEQENLAAIDPFSIVMLDVPSHEEDLANELKTVDKYLSDGGLLLLVGEIPSTLPAKIKPIAKQKGWQKVKLIETNSHQFMAVGFHLAYQKQSKKLPSNSDSNCLIIKTDKTLGLKERLKRKLPSILLYWLKNFVKK